MKAEESSSIRVLEPGCVLDINTTSHHETNAEAACPEPVGLLRCNISTPALGRRFIRLSAQEEADALRAIAAERGAAVSSAQQSSSEQVSLGPAAADDEVRPRRLDAELAAVSARCPSSSSAPAHTALLDSDKAYEEESTLEESEILPFPPDGLLGWDWPLSRQERKARVLLLDHQLRVADKRELIEQLHEAQGKPLGRRRSYGGQPRHSCG